MSSGREGPLIKWWVMNLTRWAILVATLAVIVGLHAVASQPRPEFRAVKSSVAQLRLVDDEYIVVESNSQLHFWTFPELELARVLSADITGPAWPDNNEAIHFYRRNKFQSVDTANGDVKLAAEFHHNARVVGFDEHSQEVFVVHNGVLTGYDATATPDEMVETRQLLPLPETLISSLATEKQDLRPKRGPGDGFAVFNKTTGTLWRYFPGPGSNLDKIATLGREPQLTWADNGRAFAFQPRGDKNLHIVTAQRHDQWPMPEGDHQTGTPRLIALTATAALLEQKNHLHLHDPRSGERQLTLSVQQMQSLPTLDRKRGESQYQCLHKLSDNAEYLLSNCVHRKALTTSVTNLTNLETVMLEPREATVGNMAKLFVSDRGEALLGYGNQLEYVAVGSSARRELIDPTITAKPKPERGWWFYRGLVLVFVLCLAFLMNAFNKEYLRDGKEAAYAAAAQFVTFKSSLLVLVPLVLLYLLFAYQVLSYDGPQTGIMSPGFAVIFIGLALLGAFATVVKFAMAAVSIGAAIARALKAPPGDAIVITCVTLFAALLFIPFGF